MKKSLSVLILYVVVNLSLIITRSRAEQGAGIFRILSSGYTAFTEFGPDGSAVWTNALLGSTGTIQKVASLPAADEEWTDVYAFTATVAVLTTKLPLTTIPIGMVLIPGGSNTGTNPLADGESYDTSSYPSNYILTVDSFHMDQHLVTKAQWDKVQAWAVTNGYTDLAIGNGKGSNHPVYTASWYAAVKWCNARSEMEGRMPAYYTSTTQTQESIYRTGTSDLESNWVRRDAGYRLPSHVEWEYGARGGLNSKRFPWGNTIQHTQANYQSWDGFSYDTSATRGYHPMYNDGTFPYTSPVGSFAPNGYGLYDISGNVSEWLFDWHPNYVGARRMGAGGSWFGNANGCRVGFFGSATPVSTINMGFRTVLP